MLPPILKATVWRMLTVALAGKGFTLGGITPPCQVAALFQLPLAIVL